MQANRVNGWREVLARIFAGFDTQLGVAPVWLVNPDSNRRLKLDYLFPEIGVAVRFVGLQGTGRRQRKSDDEMAEEAQREEQRASVCREHGVALISIDPDGEPKEALRHIEMGLARASAHVATSASPQGEKQRLMPLISHARRQAGELTTRLANIDRLNIYAEMWWDRQATLASQAPGGRSPAPRREYQVGMVVTHQRFGSGQVTAIAPDGDDVAVTVDFPEAGLRTFAASLVGDKLLPAEE